MTSRTITLYNPTPLIDLAVQFKNMSHPVQLEETRNLMPEVPGPALQFDTHVAVGEAAVLGWLERRFPAPVIFPQDIELYARASTLAHAILSNPDCITPLWDALKSRPHPFLTGNAPNLADLAMCVVIRDNPEYRKYFERVMQFDRTLNAGGGEE